MSIFTRVLVPVGVAAAIMVSSASAHAAVIDYTYEYHPDTVANVGIGGANAGDEYTNPSSLNDGIIADWEKPWESSPDDDPPAGTIYNLDGDAYPQPGITLTLDDTHALANLTVHYFHTEPQGVTAPTSLLVTVGDHDSFVVDDFDDSDATPTTVNREVTIDLTGYTGSTIALDFRNSEPEILGFNGEWLGLSEITVQEAQPSTVIPEPASLATLGLGALLMLRRRRTA
ncbi:MAG: PEP-CTERM sorting domain-containing protein [Phycisphaeraceae bacterium]